jgi:hypothetical protein
MRRTHVLLKIVSIIGLTIALVGCYSFSLLQDVQYAPGYGYVVKVEEEHFESTAGGPGGIMGGMVSKNYFYIFETEQEARKFVEDLKRDPKDPRYKTMRRTNFDESLYFYILQKLQPVPPSAPSGVIDRVVPPIPTGPAPQ